MNRIWIILLLGIFFTGCFEKDLGNPHENVKKNKRLKELFDR